MAPTTDPDADADADDGVSAEGDDPEPVYATRPLVAVLCELAADADPRSLTVALATTPASDLDADTDAGAGAEGGATPLDALDPETPVFSDFYFPGAGDAVNRVFGVDLATPAGQTQGRFLSHPTGGREPDATDDFAARLLVAVPPWNPTDVRAYGRDGRERDLVLVAASAPEAELKG